LLVCDGSTKDSDALLRGVAFIHLEGEHTAVYATDYTARTLKLYRVIFQDGVVTSQELFNNWNKRGEAVEIKVVSAGRPLLGMSCKPVRALFCVKIGVNNYV
jgi:hypothetical protein